MTQNQLTYQRNAETRRHNLVTEGQGDITVANDALKARAQAQSANASMLQAETQSSALAETIRSHLVNEQIANRNSIWGNINNSVSSASNLARTIAPLFGAMGAELVPKGSSAGPNGPIPDYLN